MLDLLAAFERLDADSTRRWGTMSPAQMARHCRLFCELCLGQVPVTAPIRWLARLLGPWFLRRMLAKSPTEAPKNLTTLSPLRADPSTELELDEERPVSSPHSMPSRRLPATIVIRSTDQCAPSTCRVSCATTPPTTAISLGC
jgi:hypothetical protein